MTKSRVKVIYVRVILLWVISRNKDFIEKMAVGDFRPILAKKMKIFGYFGSFRPTFGRFRSAFERFKSLWELYETNFSQIFTNFDH